MNESASEQSIFLHALDLPSPAERAAYLDKACHSNPGLRAEVDALLAAHDRLGGVLPLTAEAGSVPGGAPCEGAGSLLAGRYKLVEELGEGGMGAVWMAQQTEPVKRAVAVKLIKAGMDSKQVLARFEAERQALALMDHPNIARILDGGTTPSGRPFFVMELVKGVPITRYCDERRLPPRQRLELFASVCQAVQHAHQKGIIHRDLKPSNILVAQYDGRPVPKVIDFGIAKAAGQQLTDRTLMTGFGAVIGTLEYMSPEQAELNQLDVDTRSDIYSLGVVLYELLTGSTPLDRGRLKQAALAEILRVIREEEPPKPSTRLSGSADALPSISAQRQMEPTKLTRLVRGELDWIVMKALEKDRNRRYETANGLALDVQRYLADEPVQACPPSVGYRVRKLVRRNKAALFTVGLVAGALLAGTAVSVSQAVRANDALAAERETRATLDTERGETERQKERINRDLSDALVETTGLREKARATRPGDNKSWVPVREAARRAQTLAGHELADPVLVQRVRALLTDLTQDETDQRTVAQLEEIRLNPESRSFGVRGGPCMAVLRSYGLPIFDMAPEQASKRIAASSIRDALVTTLSELATHGPDRDDERRLLSIASRVSDDPWQRQYFDARLRHDKAALLTLARQPDVLRQRPEFIVHVGRVLRDYDMHAAGRLAAQARALYPGDPWIAGLNTEFTPEPAARIAAERIVLALRPESPTLNFGFARTLQSVGQDEEAIAYFDRAARFQIVGADVRPYRAVSAGRLLERQGKPDAAVEAYREGSRHLSTSTGSPICFLLLDYLIAALERQGDKGAAAIASLLPDYAKATATYWAEYIKQGDVLARWGKTREAIDAYAASIFWANPDNLDGAVKLRGLLTQSGLLEETLATWRKNAMASPGSLRVCLPLCAILDKIGRHEECLAVWQRWAANKDANDLRCDGWVHYGDALTRLKRLTDAEAVYRKAAEYPFGKMQTHARLVELAAKVAADFEAQADKLRAKSDWKEAVAAYRQAIARQPEDLRLYGKLGLALLERNGNDWRGDVAGCRSALERYPNMPAAHCALGLALRRTDRAGARAAFRTALQLDPRYVQAYLGLIAELTDRTAGKKDLQAAVAVCSKFMEFNRGHSLVCRGDAYRRLGQWDKASADFDGVIALYPDHTTAWIGKGDIYAATGQWDRAIAAYSRAVVADPRFPAFWLRRGQAHRKTGRWDQAVADQAEAIRLSPKTLPWQNDLAWILATCPDPLVRNPQRAVELARKVVAGMPREGGFWNTLGAAHYRAGDWKAAVAALDKSMELRAGGDAFDWFFLAMAHKKLGNAEARKRYDQAIAWMDANGPALMKSPEQAEELGRFRSEAQEVLELTKK